MGTGGNDLLLQLSQPAQVEEVVTGSQSPRPSGAPPPLMPFAGRVGYAPGPSPAKATPPNIARAALPPNPAAQHPAPRSLAAALNQAPPSSSFYSPPAAAAAPPPPQPLGPLLLDAFRVVPRNQSAREAVLSRLEHGGKRTAADAMLGSPIRPLHHEVKESRTEPSAAFRALRINGGTRPITDFFPRAPSPAE